MNFSIGSFYNELTLAILYCVVDTCDDRELCSWEQNDNSRVQEVRFCCGALNRRDDVGQCAFESIGVLICCICWSFGICFIFLYTLTKFYSDTKQQLCISSIFCRDIHQKYVLVLYLIEISDVCMTLRYPMKMYFI